MESRLTRKIITVQRSQTVDIIFVRSKVHLRHPKSRENEIEYTTIETLWRDKPLTNYANLEVTPHKLNPSFKTEAVKEEQEAFI